MYLFRITSHAGYPGLPSIEAEPSFSAPEAKEVKTAPPTTSAEIGHTAVASTMEASAPLVDVVPVPTHTMDVVDASAPTIDTSLAPVDGPMHGPENPIDTIISDAKQSRLYRAGTRIEETRNLMNIRSRARAEAIEDINADKAEARDTLKEAKDARNMARLQHNRYTQWLNKHEIRGDKLRMLEANRNYKEAGILRRHAMRSAAKTQAAREAQGIREKARSDANEAVRTARGTLSALKAEKRSLSYFRPKGGTNSLRENFAMTRGGFSIGEASPDGRLTDEQKRMLDAKLKASRNRAHVARGRKTTRNKAPVSKVGVARRAI